MKYPSGKYVIASKGGWSEQYYKDIQEIPYEKLPPHIQEREYNRNLKYKNHALPMRAGEIRVAEAPATVLARNLRFENKRRSIRNKQWQKNVSESRVDS
jgi:hypothetical protein